MPDAKPALRLPAGFIDAPPPRTVPPERLPSRTETILIGRPLAQVLKAVNEASLEDVGGGAIAGTIELTPGGFGPPGSRRFVQLADGGSVTEQSMVWDETPGGFHFRYVVWNYVTPLARAVRYAIGDFRYTPEGDSTRIVWTYAFALRRGRFPGILGPIGDRLFKRRFLDGYWSRFMRASLEQTRALAER